MAVLHANNLDRNAGRIILRPVPQGLPAPLAAYLSSLHQAIVDTFNGEQRNWQRMKLKEESAVTFAKVWDLHYRYQGTDTVTVTIDSTQDWRGYDFLVSFRAADAIADLVNLGNGNDGGDDTGYQTPTGTNQQIATRTINDCTIRVACDPTTGAFGFTVTNSVALSRTIYFRIWAAVPATDDVATSGYAAVGNGL